MAHNNIVLVGVVGCCPVQPLGAGQVSIQGGKHWGGGEGPASHGSDAQLVSASPASQTTGDLCAA